MRTTAAEFCIELTAQELDSTAIEIEDASQLASPAPTPIRADESIEIELTAEEIEALLEGSDWGLPSRNR